jgi:CIC family chloride channel protein
MGGFMAGMISAPLSSILMIFEITTDYAIILPLMFTCIISAFVARKTFSSNIFSYVLDKKGINLKKGRDINLLRNIPVSEIIRTNYFHVHLNEKLSKVLTKIMKSRNTKFFVTDDEHHLKGVISINDIKDTMDSVRALGETFIAMDLARPAKFFCYEDDTLDKVIANMPSTDVGEIPVLDKENKLIGVINWHDIIRTYNNEIAKHNMVDQLFEDISEVDNRKEIEVHGGSLMIETQVPPEFIGKSLSELNLRKRYGITVIGIKKSSLDIQDTDTVEFSPDPHYIFQGAENIIFIVPKHKRNKIPFC